jgi:integrase
MGEIKMARTLAVHRLSPTFVRQCTTPGVYQDGGGLRLRVLPNGTRIWVMRITVRSVRRDISLGVLATTSLAQARSRADAIRKAVAEGRDPVAEKRTARATATAPRMTNSIQNQRPTFEDCWHTYWTAKEPQLSNGKHRDQWLATMKTYVLPHIGHRPIADVRPGEIIELLNPIWHKKEETARRVLQRVDAVFVSAITRELRDKANPCTGVARELGNRRRDQTHYAALPHAEVPTFVQALRKRKGPLGSRLAFEFLIITATRSGETRSAMWNEIDFEARCWTIPASRMKARTEHVVPLSTRALAILRQAYAACHDSALCFPNAKGKPFSDMVFTKTLRDMALGKRATAHGFRTAFKVWAAESGIRDDVSEAALAHVDANRVRAAYKRTNFLEERRTVMQAWCNFVCLQETDHRRTRTSKSSLADFRR